MRAVRQIVHFLIAGFVVGAVVGWFTASTHADKTESFKVDVNQDTTDLDNLAAKFRKISEEDFQEYLSIKDQKARYEKADEILGKILMIMIADLGLRSSDAQLARLKSQMHDSAVKALEKATKDEQAVSGKSVREGSATALPPSEATAEKKPYVNHGVDLNDIASDKEAEAFIDKVEIADLYGELRKGSDLNSTQIESVIGSFEGDIVLDRESKAGAVGKTLQVRTQIDGQIGANGEFKGKTNLLMFKEGKRISRTHSDEGSDLGDGFKTIEGSGAIIINIYGGSGYMQLYWFSRLDQFSGLYYYKGSDLGDFSRVGHVTLRRSRR